MQKIAYEYINDYFQDIRGRYPPQGIKLLLQWPPPQTEMFPEQKSIWILVISLPYLEALKLFNLYLVLCVWLVDHLQENMCKFSWTTYLQFHNFTKSRIHEITQSIIHKGCSACIWYFFPEFIKLQIHELYSTCMYLVLWNTNSNSYCDLWDQKNTNSVAWITTFICKMALLTVFDLLFGPDGCCN